MKGLASLIFPAAHAGFMFVWIYILSKDAGSGLMDDRHDEQAHADILHHLEDQHGPKAHADQRVHAALGQPGRLEAAVDQQKFQHDDRQTAHQPQLLTADAEDKIRLPGGEAALGPLGLDALEQALAEQATAAHGAFRGKMVAVPGV